MAGFLDLIPVFQETTDKIRARVSAVLNAGLQPTDAGYTDDTPGGFYWDVTQGVIIEIDRLYDGFSEGLAAAFPAYAWGVYLDEHGVTIGVPRKNASFAGGTVTFTGTDGVVIAPNTEVGTIQTDPTQEPTTFVVTVGGTISGGTTDLAVQATEAGIAGNVAAGTVTRLISPLDGITTVTNTDPMTGGSEIESDETYRQRLLLAFQGAHGAGTVADYESWALEEPGVGFVTVQPLWAGNGTVRVVITDPQNRPCPTAVVNSLQARLDPVSGQGHGLAPIGATVTVATPAEVSVDTEATVTYQDGYSADGTGGTIAVGDQITAAIAAYIDSLRPGDDVILKAVEAKIMNSQGVLDVSGVELDSGSGFAASNVAIGALQVAASGTVTLS